jgi:hypothetical protein
MATVEEVELDNDTPCKDSDSDSVSDPKSFDNVENGSTPPKKKVKRLCRFMPTWEKEFTWCKQVIGNRFEAQCTLCHKTFSVGHGGRNDLTSHTKSDMHARNTMAAKCSSIQSFFVKSTPTGIDKQVRESPTQNSQFSSHVIYFYIYLCLIIHYAST